MSNESAKSSGITATGLLLVAFIVLKLCKVIDWSWWWVLAPAWIPAGASVLVIILYLLNEWSKGIKERQRPLPKSKWQQRMEEMQKKQKEIR